MKRYLRSLGEEFPHAAVESYRLFGWRGVYLAMSAFVLKRQPFPVSLAGIGRTHSWPEATNFVDNFSLGELRSDELENHLRSQRDAWVVDVGVNVGVTCRWWLSLSEDLRVIGIDMFQEALDFTTARIAGNGADARWTPVCSGVGDEDSYVDVRFSDPLEGTSRIDSDSGESIRRVHVQTLDTILASVGPERIALLKLDIEGASGRALAGARSTLGKCDYVIVETHSDDETLASSKALIGAGLYLFRCRGRTMWWKRP